SGIGFFENRKREASSAACSFEVVGKRAITPKPATTANATKTVAYRRRPFASTEPFILRFPSRTATTAECVAARFRKQARRYLRRATPAAASRVARRFGARPLRGCRRTTPG